MASFVVRAFRFARGLLINPVETLLMIPEVIAGRSDYRPDYRPDMDWAARLHQWLGVSYPCADQVIMHAVWQRMIDELQAKAVPFGRFTYGEYSDAEINLARAVWCVCMHKKPRLVIETGVAHGVTTRLVLEAIRSNRRGELWSIDLPHPFQPSVHNTIAAAVPRSIEYRSRWTYIQGSSRRRLPDLLKKFNQLEVFIHDSLHTNRNTRFEMESVLKVMAPGGVMIIDDIAQHQAFYEFAHDHPEVETMVCPHSDIADSYFGIVYVLPS